MRHPTLVKILRWSYTALCVIWFVLLIPLFVLYAYILSRPKARREKHRKKVLRNIERVRKGEEVYDD